MQILLKYLQMSISYKDGSTFTSTVTSIAGSPMSFQANLDGYIPKDQEDNIMTTQRVNECFIRSNFKTLSWYFADNCSDRELLKLFHMCCISRF